MILKYAIPLTLACALGVTGLLPATAQEEDRAAQLAEYIAETRARTNLTDEQVEQFTPVIEAHLEAMAAVLGEYGIDLQNRSGERKRLKLRKMRALRKDLDAVRADTAEKLSAILSEEQMEEYKKIQAERKAELRARLKEQRHQK